MIRLAIRCARADAEIVLASLSEVASGGVEEIGCDEFVEYAIYGARGEIADLPDMTAFVGGVRVAVSTSLVRDDWATRWRDFHRGAMIAGRVAIRPPWEEVGDSAAPIEIVIDPGQAFGTGSHATTRLCLELMLGLEPGESFVDLGCGSGVLAIVAIQLGYDTVNAYDYDPLAISATRSNAKANGVFDCLEAHQFDLRHELPPLGRVVVANLMRPLLLDVALLMGSIDVDLPEHLVLSGILVEEADEVGRRFEVLGYAEYARLSSGDWSALSLGRVVA